MSRPPLEVADIIRSAGAAFIERNRQWIGWKHVKVLLAIARCRTAALGGHVDECTRCGHRATNSCSRLSNSSLRHSFPRASSFKRIPVAVALRSTASTHLNTAPSHL